MTPRQRAPLFVSSRISLPFSKKTFSTTITADTHAFIKPPRRPVSLTERAALRQARKDQATRMLKQEEQAKSAGLPIQFSRWVWYMAVAVPAGLFAWGYNDEDSPPARFSRWVGFTGFVKGYTDQVAKPSHDKLLPDWSQVRICTVFLK
jgi:hypothetical protein